MINRLNKRIVSLVRAEAKRRYPEEACGLVIRSNRGFVGVSCKNVADEPCGNFVISSAEFTSIADRGEIVAVWHTHIDRPPTPSVIDIFGCNATDVNWFIVAIQKTDDDFEISEPYLLKPNQDTGYIGRPYAYGFYDCFTIAESYYRKEFGIVFSHKPSGYPEIEDWYKKGMNLLEDNFEKNGFVRLIDTKPIEGDILLIQMGSDVPNHIAIYVGDNRILHHCAGKLSSVDFYGGYWKKHTTHHLRHENRI